MFNLNEKVFILPEKVAGVVKEINEEKKQYKLTYFPKNDPDNRKNKWFKEKQIRQYQQPNDNKYYRLVRQFHKSFGHPAADRPQALNATHTVNRAGWVVEEMIEWLHATAENKDEFGKLYEMLIDSADKTYLKLVDKQRPNNVLAAQVDALTDAEYFINGGFVEIGVMPDKPFEIVHRANMNKLFPDGKPHYNEYGKVIKPDNWVAPDEEIEREVERQLKRG